MRISKIAHNNTQGVTWLNGSLCLATQQLAVLHPFSPHPTSPSITPWIMYHVSCTEHTYHSVYLHTHNKHTNKHIKHSGDKIVVVVAIVVVGRLVSVLGPCHLTIHLHRMYVCMTSVDIEVCVRVEGE